MRFIPTPRTLMLHLCTLLLGAGLACDAGKSRVEITCEDYCAKAHECDDDSSQSACVADCKDAMGDCMADEQEQALDDLDACAADSCDEFLGCTIGAGLQCSFGL